MCGKFTQMMSWREVVAFSNLLTDVGAALPTNDEVVTFTPMRAVPVVHAAPDLSRVVSPMVWGFTDRKGDGRRVPKHMHARGETVHRLPTFRDAFDRRRGITWIRTFNEGREIPTMYQDDTPTGKTWTQQWTLRRKDNRPAIIAVIYDRFDVGRGAEHEFVQVTVAANEMIATITDRMPLILHEDEVALWLGETGAPIEEVLALIRTREFSPDAWELVVEDPGKKPPRPRRPKA
jgi:putative SOS response-associated peptidase YedK